MVPSFVIAHLERVVPGCVRGVGFESRCAYGAVRSSERAPAWRRSTRPMAERFARRTELNACRTGLRYGELTAIGGRITAIFTYGVLHALTVGRVPSSGSLSASR